MGHPRLCACVGTDRRFDLVTVDRQGRAERLRRILAAVKARTPTQRDADRRLFAAQLPAGPLRDDFERHGWMSPLNSARATIDGLSRLRSAEDVAAARGKTVEEILG